MAIFAMKYDILLSLKLKKTIHFQFSTLDFFKSKIIVKTRKERSRIARDILI